MFKKVLIANRGEIALRIIRSCKELNIPTVAIHSEADATTLYVKKADEACLVGPGPVAGYLNIYRIIDLAKQRGADAIHPGPGCPGYRPWYQFNRRSRTYIFRDRLSCHAEGFCRRRWQRTKTMPYS